MKTPAQHDVAVYIGRFQPFHHGHNALLQSALDSAKHVVVVVGSAYQARTPKNPFTWAERAEMIKLALTPQQRDRLHFLPMRDYYNQARWVEAVRQGVMQIATQIGLGPRPQIALVGHFKDATSSYLKHFDGWLLHSLPRAGAIDAVHLRHALFASHPQALDATLSALASAAPSTTLEFLRAWSALPYLPALKQEWQALAQYHEIWKVAPYPPVFVTVDCVVRCADHVLLIQRGQAPGVGLHAVPGGFIEQRETAYQSALRELQEETGLQLLESSMQASLKGNAVFDHPDRSQRGRTITHAFYFDLGQRPLPEVKGSDDALSATWFPISKLVSMEEQFHDDHFHMLDHFLGLSTQPT